MSDLTRAIFIYALGAASLSFGSRVAAQGAPPGGFRIMLLAESYTQRGVVDTLSRAWSPYDSRDSVVVVIAGPRGGPANRYSYMAYVELKVGLLRWTDTTHEVPDPDAIAAHSVWIPYRQTFVATDSGQAERIVLGVLHPAAWGADLRKLRPNLVVVGLRISVAKITSNTSGAEDRSRPAMVVRKAIYVASLD